MINTYRRAIGGLPRTASFFLALFLLPGILIVSPLLSTQYYRKFIKLLTPPIFFSNAWSYYSSKINFFSLRVKDSGNIVLYETNRDKGFETGESAAP